MAGSFQKAISLLCDSEKQRVDFFFKVMFQTLLLPSFCSFTVLGISSFTLFFSALRMYTLWEISGIRKIKK